MPRMSKQAQLLDTAACGQINGESIQNPEITAPLLKPAPYLLRGPAPYPMGGFSLLTLLNSIENCQQICYNSFTLPPIFRDGVRGGSAASAVLIGG